MAHADARPARPNGLREATGEDGPMVRSAPGNGGAERFLAPDHHRGPPPLDGPESRTDHRLTLALAGSGTPTSWKPPARWPLCWRSQYVSALRMSRCPSSSVGT